MLQKLRGNSQGFTLIELMIVIAIIGILAAIAIPNFIAYRNKSYCSRAESDASNIAAEIADFYAIPTNTDCVTLADLSGDEATSNTVAIVCADPSISIGIVVTDDSNRCPADYRTAMDINENPTGYWSGFNFNKMMN